MDRSIRLDPPRPELAGFEGGTPADPPARQLDAGLDGVGQLQQSMHGPVLGPGELDRAVGVDEVGPCSCPDQQ